MNILLIFASIIGAVLCVIGIAVWVIVEIEIRGLEENLRDRNWESDDDA